MSWTELEARTVDGVTLRIDHVRAHGERRGAMLCLHAMMTDGRYFGARRDDSFAAALAARGIDVLIADFRGHGRSRPPRAGRDDWSFDDLVELDLPAMVTAAATATAGVPLVILGHSLGGLVAAAALATARIPSPHALVLVATSAWRGETLARRALMASYRAITHLVGRAPVRALRAGTADEALGYVDQLTGWARSGRWTSLRGIDYAGALATIRVPTRACCGGADWMCRPRDAEAIAGQIPTCTPLYVVEDADHFNLFTCARPELGDWIAAALDPGLGLR